MKYVITTLVLAICMFSANSQTANPFPKTINVSGSAEMEIVPDEIYVEVTLKEYEKKGSGKISIDGIKTSFINSCRAAGIPDSVIAVTVYEGVGNFLTKRKKNKDDLFTSISYQVKFNNTKQIDNLVEKLDDDATQSFNIVKVSHSKIQEYRKQLKIMAIRAAKDKGTYLAEAINEKLGEAVTITEPDDAEQASPFDNIRFSSNARYANTMLRDEASEPDDEQGIDFKKIRLRFEAHVVFALK